MTMTPAFRIVFDADKLANRLADMGLPAAEEFFRALEQGGDCLPFDLVPWDGNPATGADGVSEIVLELRPRLDDKDVPAA